MNKSLNIEIWKDIPDYEGYYQASNLGDIKSLDRIIWIEKRKRFLQLKGKILKPRLNKYGYLCIVLCKDGIRKDYSVHQIIAKTFINNPNNYPDIHHKNSIKIDNKSDNLEWVNSQINNFYRWKDKEKIEVDRVINRKRKYSLKMSEGHATKLTSEQVLKIRELYSTGEYTHAQLGEMFGINHKYAYSIVNRRVWKHI